jgi:hypothetical protein
MSGTRRRLGILSQFSGDQLNAQAKVITQLLPSKLESTPVDGPKGIIHRFLAINGILIRDQLTHGRTFWIGLFLKFALSAFFVITILFYLLIELKLTG